MLVHTNTLNCISFKDKSNFLKLHRPVCVSLALIKVPMLVVSSFDKKIALKRRKNATIFMKQPASRFPEVRNIFQDLNETIVPISKASTQSLKKSSTCFVFFSDVIPPRLNQVLGREKTFVLNQKVSGWLASFVSPLYVESPYDEVGSVSLYQNNNPNCDLYGNYVVSIIGLF